MDLLYNIMYFWSVICKISAETNNQADPQAGPKGDLVSASSKKIRKSEVEQKCLSQSIKISLLMLQQEGCWNVSV